ncbi:MAG: CoA ester lyase [Gammaproteobacteria bacterium]|nr:CoA ester lyase [Gammaproteobacteria bacterium]
MLKRSFLFVPGDRPERFDKATRSGAHGVIIDLDDAVAPDSKAAARSNVAQWLDPEHPVYVRINRTHTDSCNADLAAIADRPGLIGVVVPDAETPEQLLTVANRLAQTAQIIALTETALGIWNAYALASMPQTTRLAFGSLDLMKDTGIEDDDKGLLFARSRIVIASRAANIEPPVDGVTTTIDDLDAVSRDATRSRYLGFGGKLCIHPSHVDPINRAFDPSASDIAWAKDILEAVGDSEHGAIRYAGEMVDRPVIERAKNILGLTGRAQRKTDN